MKLNFFDILSNIVGVNFQIFGGRDWSVAANIANASPQESGGFKRGASIKFRKKRSIGNIQALKVRPSVTKTLAKTRHG